MTDLLVSGFIFTAASFCVCGPIAIAAFLVGCDAPVKDEWEPEPEKFYGRQILESKGRVKERNERRHRGTGAVMLPPSVVEAEAKVASGEDSPPRRVLLASAGGSGEQSPRVSPGASSPNVRERLMGSTSTASQPPSWKGSYTSDIARLTGTASFYRAVNMGRGGI